MSVGLGVETRAPAQNHGDSFDVDFGGRGSRVFVLCGGRHSWRVFMPAPHMELRSNDRIVSPYWRCLRLLPARLLGGCCWRQPPSG